MVAHYGLVLIVIVLLFPGLRRRLGRGIQIALAGFAVFLLVAVLAQLK